MVEKDSKTDIEIKVQQEENIEVNDEVKIEKAEPGDNQETEVKIEKVTGEVTEVGIEEETEIEVEEVTEVGIQLEDEI